VRHGRADDVATMLCTRSNTSTTRDTSVRRPLVSSSTLMRMGVGPVRTCDGIQFKRVLSAISGRIGLILLDSCCHRSAHARCEDAWIDGGHGGDRGTGPARSVGRLEEPPGLRRTTAARTTRQHTTTARRQRACTTPSTLRLTVRGVLVPASPRQRGWTAASASMRVKNK